MFCERYQDFIKRGAQTSQYFPSYPAQTDTSLIPQIKKTIDAHFLFFLARRLQQFILRLKADHFRLLSASGAKFLS